MPPAKYQPIVEQLRGELAQQRPGARFISENELALRFRVSRPTAARVLRELTDLGLIERRVGSGSFVRDPGTAAPGEEARTIGLVLAGLGATEVWDPLTRHIGQASSAEGITVLVNPNTAPRDEVAAAVAQAEWLLEQGVDGVLFAPLEAVAQREAENRAICQRLTDAGVQVVLLDRDLAEFPGRSEFDVIGVDNVRAGALIGTHLADLGLRRPVLVSYPDFPCTTDLRSAGCRWALGRAGVDVRPDWHVQGDPSDDDWLGSVLEEHRPDVAVCSNDRTAALLMQTLTRLGRQVPDDIAVTGFDDVVYAQLLPVALTTVAQPFASIARAAVERLASRIDDPSLEPVEIALPPQLVIRASTSAAGPAPAP